MKHSVFQAVIVSIVLYGCTTWTLTKRLEKKLDGNYTRMLRAKLNRSRRQHPTKQQLYVHLLPITKTIQITPTRHSGHSWRSRDEFIGDVLLSTHSHSRVKPGWPAGTYIQLLCEDTRCSPEDLPKVMNDREGIARKGQGYPCWWHDKIKMMIYIYIYIYIYNVIIIIHNASFVGFLSHRGKSISRCSYFA